VKRMLLVLAASVMFLSTFVTPNVVRTDGGSGASGCGAGGGLCKP
jgi:hypothetical protein